MSKTLLGTIFCISILFLGIVFLLFSKKIKKEKISQKMREISFLLITLSILCGVIYGMCVIPEPFGILLSPLLFPAMVLYVAVGSTKEDF